MSLKFVWQESQRYYFEMNLWRACFSGHGWQRSKVGRSKIHRKERSSFTDWELKHPFTASSCLHQNTIQTEANTENYTGLCPCASRRWIRVFLQWDWFWKCNWHKPSWSRTKEEFKWSFRHPNKKELKVSLIKNLSRSITCLSWAQCSKSAKRLWTWRSPNGQIWRQTGCVLTDATRIFTNVSIKGEVMSASDQHWRLAFAKLLLPSYLRPK